MGTYTGYTALQNCQETQTLLEVQVNGENTWLIRVGRLRGATVVGG